MARVDLKERGVDPYYLKDRHRVFVAEYTTHYNATQAAKKAGYKHPAIMGRRLLDGKSYPKVARAIGAIQRKNLEVAVLTKEAIIEELSNLAMRDVIDLYDEQGNFILHDPKKLKEIPAYLRRCIDSIEYVPSKYGTHIKVSMAKKLEAFDMLMKHFGMYSPQEHKVEHSLSWDKLYEGHEEEEGGPGIVDAALVERIESDEKESEDKDGE